MHVFNRLFPAALSIAALASAIASTAQASMLLVRHTPSGLEDRCPNGPGSPDHLACTPDTAALPAFLDTAARALIQSGASPATPHPHATGTAGDPAAPRADHARRPGRDGGAEVFAPGRAAVQEAPAPPHAKGTAGAAMALPEGAVLFLGGALPGSVLGLALASLVAGLRGPSPARANAQPSTDPAWR